MSTIKNTQGTPNSLGKDPDPARIKQLNSLFKHVNIAILKTFQKVCSSSVIQYMTSSW